MGKEAKRCLPMKFQLFLSDMLITQVFCLSQAQIRTRVHERALRSLLTAHGPLYKVS